MGKARDLRFYLVGYYSCHQRNIFCGCAIGVLMIMGKCLDPLSGIPCLLGASALTFVFEGW